MFKEQMQKLKNLIPKKLEKGEGEEKPNKRKIENLVAFLIILIITLIAINSILGKDKPSNDKEEQGTYKVLADVGNSDENYNDVLEKRLENILETIVGIRKSKCSYNVHYI